MANNDLGELQRIPVLPLQSAVLFPYFTVDLQVTRARELLLVQAQLQTNEEFILVRSNAPDPDHTHAEHLAPVGVIGRIIRHMLLPNGSLQITVEGICRARLGKFTQTEPYFVAEAERLLDQEEITSQTEDLVTQALAALNELLNVDPHYAREAGQNFKLYMSHPGQFADLIGAEVHFPLDIKQRLLESIPWKDRLNRLIKYIKRETERAEIAEEFVARTRRSINRERREVYLRQQLKEIRRELGEEDPQEQEYQDILARVAQLPIPENVRRQILSEAQRLRLISTASSEYGATRSFLDWALALPWNNACDDTVPIARAERALHEGFVGIQRAKERILDHLAVRRKVGARTILTLAGPSGVGKSAIGQAIAQALHRPFIQINVAGAASEPEIVGHRRTFLGAQPGVFIRALRDAGVCNPVIMVDNIDRIVDDFSRGAIAASLLSALHPVRNAAFIDRFLNFPFDLSQVLFIVTASAADDIPEALLDDIEIVELSGYIELEKVHIAEKHLIPELLDRYKLSAFELSITPEGLRTIIRRYTLEAGLSELRRNLETICRKCTRQKESGYASQWTVDAESVGAFLGTPQFIPEAPEAQPEIGVAMGVAWTQAGGDLMLIEGLKMPGSGQVVYTGSLGEVMKESIQAAYSYVRAKADMLKIDPDEFGTSDVHIHFPSGSIPKDGPSAGVTVSLVIASVMSNRPIRHDVAMTGEVTLRGKIIAVGGLKEKVAAAARSGITEIIIPRENEKDLQEIPDEIRRKMTFHMVERVDEVFARALLAPEHPVVSLESVLEQEVARVKSREQRRKQVADRRRTAAAARRRKSASRKPRGRNSSR
jgi:ATP-dependent Lon protease